MLPVILASKSTLCDSDLVSIVHDVRNPLATIHAGAEMLARSMLSQPQVQRIAVNMYRASVRMRELLDEILDESRRAAEQMEVSDLRELVTSAVDEIAARAEFQSVDIVRLVPERLLMLLHRDGIHRVLVNLLVNALEAMADGGRILISAASSRGSVLIRVRDSGPGIAPELAGRLFQRFATAGKTDGIGLGLASSRKTVLDHDGEMWVESSLKGTCFVVRLPIKARTHTVCRAQYASEPSGGETAPIGWRPGQVADFSLEWNSWLGLAAPFAPSTKLETRMRSCFGPRSPPRFRAPA